MSFFQLKNPIPESCKDTGELSSFWSKFRDLIVPYYGFENVTSHSFLRVLFHLTVKSPSFKAVDSDLNNYAFGKNIDIVKKTIPGWNDPEIVGTDDPEGGRLPRAEQLKFIEWLGELGISLLNIIDLSAELATHQRQSGNAFLNVKIATVGATVRVSLDVVHYRHICYLNTSSAEEKEFIITPIWSEDFWRKKPPRIVKASFIGKPFLWTEDNNGVMETVVHFKTDGNDDGDWYGRPNILSVMEWMFSEISLGDHSCKVNSTELISKILILLEGEDENADEGGDENKEELIKSVTRKLRPIMTTKGGKNKSSSVAALEYPNGLTPPKIEKLNINRDTSWFNSNIEKASGYIYAVLGWAKELTGFTTTKAGIGSNILIDLFLVKDEATIKPLQCRWENNWGWIFGEIATAVGRPDMSEFGIKYQDNVKALTDSLIRARDGMQVPTGNINPNEDGS